jgi:hypothetical protein
MINDSTHIPTQRNLRSISQPISKIADLFRQSFLLLAATMSADDEEIEACVALGQLRGRGKRHWGSVEEDDGSEPSTPVSKIPRTSKSSSVRPNRPRPSSTPYSE